MPSTKTIGRSARSIVEITAEFVRDCSDLNPIIKGAAGGLANALKVIRLQEANEETLRQITTRIALLSHLLVNDRDDTIVESRVRQVEAVMLTLTSRLNELHRRRQRRGGRLRTFISVPDEAEILSECERQLDDVINDINFTLNVSQATRAEANYNQLKILLHRILQGQQEGNSNRDANLIAHTVCQFLAAQQERELQASPFNIKWTSDGQQIRLHCQFNPYSTWPFFLAREVSGGGLTS